MGIHLRLGGDDWGIIFTWDSFQPSTPGRRFHDLLGKGRETGQPDNVELDGLG